MSYSTALTPASLFLPTLSMRRATRFNSWFNPLKSISTHALHAESDDLDVAHGHLAELFLPTLSMRRATRRSCKPRSPVSDFYPRSPCGERPVYLPSGVEATPISTHALHAESDSKRQQKHIQNLQPICKNAKSLRFMPAYLTSHSL